MSLRPRFALPAIAGAAAAAVAGVITEEKEEPESTDPASVQKMAHHNDSDSVEDEIEKAASSSSSSSSTKRIVWDRRWQYLPVIGAFIWLATLIVLLVQWAACNSPIYPSQNGILPFISDIGAQKLKPVFVLGCILSGLAFLGTLFLLHRHRDLPSLVPPLPSTTTSSSLSITATPSNIHTNTTPPLPPPSIPHPPTLALTLASTLSLLFTTLGVLSLILLSGFDTFLYPKLHSSLLIFFGTPFFLGCAGSLSLLTIQRSINPECVWLKYALRMKVGAAVLLLVLTVSFAVRMTTAERPFGWQFDQAAVLEWLMGVAAAAYMLTYWYDLRHILRVQQGALAKRDGEDRLEV